MKFLRSLLSRLSKLIKSHEFRKFILKLLTASASAASSSAATVTGIRLRVVNTSNTKTIVITPSSKIAENTHKSKKPDIPKVKQEKAYLSINNSEIKFEKQNTVGKDKKKRDQENLQNLGKQFLWKNNNLYVTLPYKSTSKYVPKSNLPKPR